MTAEQWVLLFFLYGFAGWLCECIYAFFYYHGKLVNRGFLHGPICPMYGFGGVLCVWLLTPLTHLGLLAQYLGGVILLTVLEYLTGWMMDKLFHARWWDYSTEPHNLDGYICLSFSLLWGIAAVLLLHVVQPLALSVVTWASVHMHLWLAGLLVVIFVADVIWSVLSALKITNLMATLEDIRKKGQEKIAQMQENEHARIAQEKAAIARGEEEAMKNLSNAQKRLIEVFPSMKSERYATALQGLKERLQERNHSKSKT